MEKVEEDEALVEGGVQELDQLLYFSVEDPLDLVEPEEDHRGLLLSDGRGLFCTWLFRRRKETGGSREISSKS